MKIKTRFNIGDNVIYIDQKTKKIKCDHITHISIRINGLFSIISYVLASTEDDIGECDIYKNINELIKKNKLDLTQECLLRKECLEK